MSKLTAEQVTARYEADIRPAYRISFDDGEIVEVKRAVWPIRYAHSIASGRDFTIAKVSNGKPTAYHSTRYRLWQCAECAWNTGVDKDPEFTPVYGPVHCDHPIHW